MGEEERNNDGELFLFEECSFESFLKRVCLVLILNCFLVCISCQGITCKLGFVWDVLI